MLFVGACAPKCAAGRVLINGQCHLATTQTSEVAGAMGQSMADPETTDGVSGNGAPRTTRAAGGTGTAGHSGAGAAGHGGSAARATTAANTMAADSGMSSGGGQDATGVCAGQTDTAVCDGAMLHHCDSSGNDSSPETCMSEALCQVGVANGSCAECTPGTYKCDDVTLQLCSDAGKWEESEKCASAALCNAMVGACTEMVCQPGKKTCNASGTLQTCSADGASIESEEPCGMGLCDAQHGRCNMCVPNAKSCNGDTAVTCSSDGQQMNEMECTAAAGDCATSKCQTGRCVPGAKRAGESCTAGGGKVCNAEARCVACVTKTDCAGKFDMCTSGQCVAGPGCGNGEIDPGEVCETAGPNAYAPGTCDPTKCHLMDAQYARCQPMGGCPNGTQGWFCGGTNACSHVCTTDDQCATTQGKGRCIHLTDNDAMKYCVIDCGSCPPGLSCNDYSSIPGASSDVKSLRMLCGS